MHGSDFDKVNDQVVTLLNCNPEVCRTKCCRPQLMPVVLTEAEGRPAVNSSYFSSINPADGQCLLEKYSDRFSDCCFGLLGNLYACDGKPGKVISLI